MLSEAWTAQLVALVGNALETGSSPAEVIQALENEAQNVRSSIDAPKPKKK